MKLTLVLFVSLFGAFQGQDMPNTFWTNMKYSIDQDHARIQNMTRNLNEDIRDLKDLILFLAPRYPGAIRNITLGNDYLYVQVLKDWEDARQDCHRRGFQLLKIDSEEENRFIHEKFSGILSLWLSGTDANHEGCWTWASDTVQLFSQGYTRWHPDKPDGGDRANCAILHRSTFWRDISCSDWTFYVCKRPIRQPATSLVSVGDIHNTPLC